MLRIASSVDTVQVCSKGWCHHELSSEIMAKKIMHNQSKLLSSGKKNPLETLNISLNGESLDCIPSSQLLGLNIRKLE